MDLSDGSREPPSTPSTPAGARERLRAMVPGTRSLHGRGRELSALTSALDEASDGRGALWLLTGEPGIGKSRLCEETARVAAERDVSVLWGRCWEVGGAPAYWPWIQVARTLLRGRGAQAGARLTHGRTAELAELLPELSGAAGAAPSLEPEQARFRLLDALSSLLCEAATETPILIVLEDLHAADASSLLLLDFLSRQLSWARLLVLGTYREADVTGAVAETLSRLRGQPQVRALPLGRLAREEVAALLHDVLGRAPEPALTDAVLEASEGNPLFVGEVARMHARVPGAGTGAGRSSTTAAIPASLKTAIRQRLRTLSPKSARVVGLASVVGRELPTAALAQLAAGGDPGLPTHELAAALDECAAAEVLLEVAPGLLRFSHILLQQVAYAELDEQERARAHLAFADALEREGRPERGSELTHHLLAAGSVAAQRALTAASAAARRALGQHAFAEAAELFERALCAQALAPHPPVERYELLLELGRAHLLAHALDAGRKACSEAAALARTLGDATLFARAALAHGAVFVLATVSPALVALLEEALERLGPEDSALRASVMARLAAALQPADDPEPPIELARQAVAMARRLGDPDALRATLRAACSAMIDLADPNEVYPLCKEHAALARHAGDLADLFRAELRLAMSASELGLMHEAYAAVDGVVQIAEQLRQPHYAWRAAALEAMRAQWLGELSRAEALRARARELGARAGDPNAEHNARTQRVSHLLLAGDYDGVLAELAALRHAFAGVEMALRSLAVYEGAVHYRAGRHERAATVLKSCGAELRASLIDHTMLEIVSDACIGLGDRALAEEMLSANAPRASHLVTGGVLGLSWEVPVGVVCARLAKMLGRLEEAEAYYRRALEFLVHERARVHEAWVGAELAELLCSSGRTTQGLALAARAAQLACELAIAPLSERMARLGVAASPSAAATATAASTDAPAPPSVAPASLPLARGFGLVREGEFWLVEHDGRRFPLRDSKGLALLARLVDEPGRELHVLDLIGASGIADGGDSGELIDSEARAAYQARVRALREEIEEAEGFSDLGRAERARQELEALSRELSRAVGAGGRARRGGSAVERARVNVQRRLRDACERIREHDPTLGKHLDWALHTGTFCSYRPE